MRPMWPWLLPRIFVFTTGLAGAFTCGAKYKQHDVVGYSEPFKNTKNYLHGFILGIAVGPILALASIPFVVTVLNDEPRKVQVKFFDGILDFKPQKKE